MKFRVTFLSANDGPGGAGRAVLRISEALDQFFPAELQLKLRVIEQSSGSSIVSKGQPKTPPGAGRRRWGQVHGRKAIRALYLLLGGKSVFSTAEIETGLGRELDREQPDLLVLNWLGDYTIALEEVTQLSMPIVARLSDEWFFLGARHFSETSRAAPVSSWQRLLDAIFINWRNSRVRARKEALIWGRLSGLVYPGSSVPDHISAIARSYGVPIYQIPNPIVLPALGQLPRGKIREIFDMATEAIVVGFGGDKADKDPRKGLDVLLSSLKTLVSHQELSDRQIEVHIFGASRARETSRHGFRVVYHKFLSQDLLNQFFQAIDLFAFPSVAETFGNVLLEAQANGCPAIAFDVGGVSMQIEDGVSGFIVRGTSTEDFRGRLLGALGEISSWPQMGEKARQRIAQEFSEQVVAKHYLDFFREVLS